MADRMNTNPRLRVEERIITSARRSLTELLQEVFERSEVLFNIATRDIAVRFRQTYIGLLWLLLKPLAMSVVLFFAFGKIGGLSEKSPASYWLIVLTGIIPWQYFSLALTEATNSLGSNRQLVTHTYIPRLTIPLATMLGLLSDLAISLIVLVASMIILNIDPTWKLIAFPAVLFVYWLFVFGLGLILSSTNAIWRDIQHLLPFVLQIMLFASPIGYTSQSVPDRWQFLFCLNPLSGLIELMRWSIIPNYPVHVLQYSWAVIASIISLVFGLTVFKHFDHDMADRI